MQPPGSETSRHFATVCQLRLAGAACLLVALTGCGSGGTTPKSSPASLPQPVPQTYFAPYVFNTSNAGTPLVGPYLYQFDDVGHVFSQSTFQIVSPQRGPQTINAGTAQVLERGLLALNITANYVPSGNGFAANTSNLPTGGFAVEFASQAGGFAQLAGQPAVPLGAATQCPSSKVQSYLFVTVPGSLMHAGAQPVTAPNWDPAQSTAYGTVDISSSDGVNVAFANIQQHTLPAAGGTGQPAMAAPASVTGICGATVLGNTVSVPGQLITKNPGIGSNTNPQASIGIGPTGMLVEDNGAIVAPGASNNGAYENVLGAGSGAVGLPKPSGPVDISALRAAQYLGFVTGAGTVVTSGQPTDWSSHVASFGFSSAPSTCMSVTPANGTVLYGGDFPHDDPAPGGFGNCDLAIDFGTQDSANNGLFPNAKVWMGADYAANGTGKTYNFPAVAIAAQLNSKYVILILGADTQPWSIYLSQTN